MSPLIQPSSTRNADWCSFVSLVVIKLEGGTEEDMKLLDAPVTVAGEDEKGEKKAENEDEKAPENGGEVR